MLFGVLPMAKRHKPRHSLLGGTEIWLGAPLNHTSQSPLWLGRPCDSILANQEWAKVMTSLAGPCLKHFPHKPLRSCIAHLLDEQVRRTASL